jgi:CheY-like chemotaxis protein
VVSVRDTGVGIPADQLPHIFEMFAQVDQSLERSRGGLGIGLTLVRRLAELHGGSAEARSEGAGKGSEFVICLPVLEDAGTMTHEPAQLDGEAGGPGKGRVLLVDDNRDAAVSLATVLKASGYEVRVAYDGEEGIATAERFRPQIVLLDISLPKLNGYAVARRLRAQPGGKEMVLIATTGWGQDDDRRRSFEAGFDHHMVKPIDPSALQNLLTESAPAPA